MFFAGLFTAIAIVYPLLLRFGASRSNAFVQGLGYLVFITFMLSYLYTFLINPGVVQSLSKVFEDPIIKQSASDSNYAEQFLSTVRYAM